MRSASTTGACGMFGPIITISEPDGRQSTIALGEYKKPLGRAAFKAELWALGYRVTGGVRPVGKGWVADLEG